MNKLEEMGFYILPNGTYYEPILMKCQVTAPKNGRNAAIIVGRCKKTAKRLKAGQTYGLWVMYAQNADGEYGLYFKEEGDPLAYKLIHDRLRFVFEAEAFAKISTSSSCTTLKYFVSRSIVENPEELCQFFKLVKGALSEIKREIVRTFLSPAVAVCPP